MPGDSVKTGEDPGPVVTEAGIHRVYLFASADGMPVYEKEGFRAVENTMLAVLR